MPLVPDIAHCLKVFFLFQNSQGKDLIDSATTGPRHRKRDISVQEGPLYMKVNKNWRRTRLTSLQKTTVMRTNRL